MGLVEPARCFMVVVFVQAKYTGVCVSTDADRDEVVHQYSQSQSSWVDQIVQAFTASSGRASQAREGKEGSVFARYAITG